MSVCVDILFSPAVRAAAVCPPSAEMVVNQLYYPAAEDYPLAVVISRMNSVLEPARALITEVSHVVSAGPACGPAPWYALVVHVRSSRRSGGGCTRPSDPLLLLLSIVHACRGVGCFTNRLPLFVPQDLRLHFVEQLFVCVVEALTRAVLFGGPRVFTAEDGVSSPSRICGTRWPTTAGCCGRTSARSRVVDCPTSCWT